MIIFNLESLKNKKVKAPWWDGIVKVINIFKVNDQISIQGVYLENNLFFEHTINIKRFDEIEILKENDFKGDPTKFFLALIGNLIRINYEYNPYFAVGISKIDPLPHQLEAVYEYIVPRPRIRFLIADDPGAGKTIMAGLVLKELKYRKLIKRILIVSPGHLIDNWMRELNEKFSENFTHIDRQYLNSFWNQNIWRKETQILSSIDFLKQPDIKEKLENEKWDMIIVDEAHKMSARLSGSNIKKTQRYLLGEILSNNCDHILFLTATPHRGDMNNFTLFLSLLEPEMFGLSKQFHLDEQLQSLEDKENSIFVRRLKESMVDFNGKELFPKRYPKTIKYELTPEEQELYQKVSNYVKVNYNKALQQKRKTVAFALIMLQRRLSSSIRSIKKSLIRRKKKLEKINESDFVRDYEVEELIEIENEYRTILDSDEIDDMSEKERMEIEKKIEVLTMARNIEDVNEEIEKLSKLIKLAEEIEQKGEETKLQNLWDSLKGEIRDNNEKLIIFTEFRDTLEYLEENITNWGFEVVTIHGGMSMDKRIRAEKEFKTDKQILVATEAAGEGINLQFCWLMVNYDIPWNPNRLEQRMGRIHRYLQTHDCYIYNCVAENTMEGRVFKRLLEKLETIRIALGSDKVFDVLGEIFTDIGLNQLFKEAINTPNGWEYVLTKIDRMDQKLIERANKVISAESLAQKHLDLSILKEEIRKSKEFRLWPEYIRDYCQVAIKSFGGEITSTGIFKLPKRILDMWNYNLEIEYGPLMTKYKNVTFDKEIWKQDSQKEYIAPGHPLLESLIEGNILNFSDEISRGTVYLDPDNKLLGLIWFFKVKVTDGNKEVVSEKIIAIYQNLEGKLQDISPLIIWDLVSDSNLDFNRIESSDEYDKIYELMKSEDLIRTEVEEILRAQYYKDLSIRREKNHEIKKKAIETNMNYRISESIKKIYEYKEKIEKGKKYELALNNELKNKEKLIGKKNQKLIQIGKEKEITLNVPELLGIIMVIPKRLVAKEREISYEEGVDKNAVDKAAMDVVMTYEKSQKRNPVDVSRSTCGYDIRSENPKTKEIRHIEVKGHSKSGDIFITPNEWFMGGRFGDGFWLYIVDNALVNPGEPVRICNPVKNLKYDKILETKRYIIKEENWKNKIQSEV